MKKLMALVGGVGFLALQACGAGSMAEETVATDEAGLTSSIAITTQWNTGYCGNVTIWNGMGVSANAWTTVLDLQGSTIQIVNGAKNVWNGVASGTTGLVSVTPASYNSYIAPGGTVTFGFCANTNTGARAVIKADNMTTTAYAACSSNSGLNPTRAALAVAMATEMGRWQPQTDLVKNAKVEISATGLSRCYNGCPLTKAILSQQDSSVSQMIPQNLFNPTSFMEDMKASFDRQKNKIDDLTRNNPSQLPPAHKMTLVGGPVNLGGGACGPHYVYSVTDLNNIPLSSSQAGKLANALCFYGQGSCGANPYIGFISSSVPGCPSGKTCIAIDPLGGDDGSTSTTSAGSAPTYPLNRYLDWTYSKLNSACITKAGQYGKMKCSTSVGCTNGYLYCTP